jgi:hypothetical protein
MSGYGMELQPPAEAAWAETAARHGSFIVLFFAIASILFMPSLLPLLVLFMPSLLPLLVASVDGENRPVIDT